MIDVICDLDGVVYRGNQVLDGVPAAMRRLLAAGGRLIFVTNNSTRTPTQVAAKVEQTTGISVPSEQVCTSALAAARMLGPDDSPVLVVGEEGIHQAAIEQGLRVADDHHEARSVVVGLWRDVTYRDIAAAADAVRDGARFVATNTDPTYPTATGLLPGSGAIVAAIATAAGVEPEVAGKPHPPMRRMVKELVPGEAWVIGDRLDTDIALADGEPDWSSILVLTGVTGSASPGADADYVVPDFAAAVDVILDEIYRR